MDITLAFWIIAAFIVCYFFTQHVTLFDKKDKGLIKINLHLSNPAL